MDVSRTHGSGAYAEEVWLIGPLGGRIPRELHRLSKSTTTMTTTTTMEEAAGKGKADSCSDISTSNEGIIVQQAGRKAIMCRAACRSERGQRDTCDGCRLVLLSTSQPHNVNRGDTAHILGGLLATQRTFVVHALQNYSAKTRNTTILIMIPRQGRRVPYPTCEVH